MKNDHKLLKRFLAFLLSFAMVITYMPMSVIAYSVEPGAAVADAQEISAEATQAAAPAEEAQPETAEEPAPAAEETAPAAEVQAEPQNAEPETPGATEKSDVKASEPTTEENTTEPAESKETAEPEAKLLNKDTELIAEGDGYVVSASVSKEAKVPADTELQVAEIDKDSDDYAKYYDEAIQALKEDSETFKKIKTIKFYDISLEAESQENSVQPEAPVGIKIEYENGVKVDSAEDVKQNLRIVHFGEQETTVLDNNKDNVDATVEQKKMTDTSFETEGFSIFAVVVIEEDEGVLSIHQDGYEITINYTEEANIPVGTELVVEQITPDQDRFWELRKQTIEEMNKGVEWENPDLPDPRTGIADAAFFDITLMYEGNEIEPDVPLDVHISYDNGGLYIPDGEKTKVVHFADKGTEFIDSVETETSDEKSPEGLPEGSIISDVEFQQGSFSVSGVITTDEYIEITKENIGNGPIMLRAANRAASEIAASKSVTDTDGDGVYEMALSVTGASESSSTTKVSKSNVVLVIDTSGSMQNNYTYSPYTYSASTYNPNAEYYGVYNGNYYRVTRNNSNTGWRWSNNTTNYAGTVYTRQTRMAATKEAAVALVDALFANNKNETTEDGVNLNDVIEISLVTFAGASNNNTNGYLRTYDNAHFSGTADSQSAATLKNYINSVNAVGGTNWEQALKAAKTSADTYSSQTGENTAVIFLTDGKPTFYGANDSGNGQEGDTNVHTCWNNADDDARTIVSGGYTLYNIFAFGTDTGTNSGSNFLKALTNYAYRGTGTYSNYETTQYTRDYFFDASDTEALTEAFKKIIDKINDTVGFGGVDYEDGVTVGVTNTSVTVDGTVHDESFRYTVRNSNNAIVYTVKIANGSATFNIGGQEYTDNSPETVTTVIDPNDHSKDIVSEVYSVEVNGVTYSMSPATINKDNGLVDWDLAGLGILQDGYTYTVAFDVWPNQYSYDLVADLNNGVKTLEQIKQELIDEYGEEEGNLLYDQITAALQGPDAAGQYSILTNWKQEVNYYTVETEEDESGSTTTYTPQPTKELPNPNPVALTSKPLPMYKVWDSNLSPEQIGNLLYEDYPTNSIPTEYKVKLHVWKADTAQALQDLVDQYAGDPATASANDYIEKTLGWNGREYDWDDVLSIAPGTMVSLETAIDMGIDVATEEHQKNIVTYNGKQYYIIEKGHYYYVTEDQIDWHFELETVVYHPMMVDGTLSNVTFITDADGNITGVEDIEDMTHVTATNSKTAELDITKKIVDNTGKMTDAQKDAETFTYKISLTVPADADMSHTNALEWVARYDDDPSASNRYYIYGYQTSEEAEVLGLDDDVERFNGKVYGQYTVSYPGGGATLDEIFTPDEGGETKSGTIYVTLKQNEVIRFTNLPSGTQYRIEEMYNNLYQANPSRDADANLGDSAPASNIEQMGYAVTVATKNGEPTVNGRVVTGTINELNKRYYNQFTNTLDDTAVVNLAVKKHLDGYEWSGERYYVRLSTDEDNDTINRFTDKRRFLSAASGSEDVTYTYAAPLRFGEEGTYKYYFDEMENNTDTAVISGTRVKDITYDSQKVVTVKVEKVNGELTITEVSGDDVEYDEENGLITTTITNKKEKTSLSGEKTWDDANNQDGYRPTAIIVTVMQKVVGAADAAWEAVKVTVDGQEQDLTARVTEGADGKWTYSFADLPRYTAEGQELVYKIVESAAADAGGDLTKYQEDYTSGEDGYEKITAEDGSVTFKSDVKNTHEVETVDVTAKKIWNDNNNAEGVRPESIIFQLYKSVDGSTPAPVKDANNQNVTITLSGTGDTWTNEITGLPKNEGGKEITYSFKELDGAGNPVENGGVLAIGNSRWTATYAGPDSEAVTTITNTPSKTTVSFPVKKSLSVPQGMTGPEEWTYTITVEAQNGAPAAATMTGTVTNEADTATFGPFTYAAAGTYTYKVTESGTVEGVTNDAEATSGKTVTVTVTPNDDGTLSATASSTTTAPLTFTNTYSVEPATTSFPVTKELVVPEGLTGPAEWSYTINVAGEEGKPEPATKTGTVDQDNDTVTFGPITYTAPGTYTYTVSETGTVAGVTNDAEAAGKTVTVTVVDNGDGTLTATASSTTDAPLTFTNTYNAQPTTASFPVKKDLVVPEGLVGPEEWEYTIDVTAEDGAPEATTMTGTVDQDTDTVNFGPITYTAPGTYTYTVSETGTVEGVTNDKDAAGKTVTVTVVDNGDGSLTATASSTTDAPLTFTNTYKTSSTTVSFPVTKELVVPEGLTGPADWSFDITVAAQNGAPEAETMSDKVTKAAPTVTFGDFTYTAPGTYTYNVTESGTVAGVTNDAEATKTVTVTVVDNGDGTLTATASSTADAPLTFTNTYNAQPTTVSFPVTKELVVPEGLTGPADWSFDITVAAHGGAPEAETMTGKVTKAAPTVTFGDFTYTAPGTYTYNVTESGTVAGVTNDAEATKTVTVTVVDNGDGTLTATASSTTEEPLTFTNTYDVQPTTASFPVEKILTVPEGQTGPEDWSYTINVAAEGGAPEAETMTGTVTKAEPKVTFGNFTYTAPGTYTYTVTEEGTVPGVVNDSAAATGKTVTVTVVDNGDGTLTATPSSTAENTLKFTNSYNVEGTSVTFPVKKIMSVPEGLDGPADWSFDITVAAQGGAPEAETMTGTVTKTSDTFEFGPFNYTAPGTYTYKVTESGTVAGVTNDEEATTGKTVTVTVVDNKDGTMTATASATTDAPLTFTNEYDVEPTTASFPVEKILTVPEGLEGPAEWSYTIDVEAQDEAPEAETMTGTVDQDNDTVNFGPITYTAPGTYTYTVSETGTVAGVTNDADAAGKTVTVTVVDNKDGTLTATADSTEENPLTFTNTYDVEPTTAKFPVKKNLVIPEGVTGPTEWSYTINVTGAPAAATMSGTINQDTADSTISFGDFTYTAPGTYTYSVTESGTVAGVTNDTEATKTVTVEVVDNGDGTLTATASSTTEEPLTFTNTYSVEPTTISFPVKKEMVVPEGLDGPADWSYTINVAAQDGAPTADAMSGTVTKTAPSTTFGPFTYTEAGTYTYKVTERGTIAGVTNDAEATSGKTVTVEVVDNGDGTLTATANADANNPVKFVNTYSAEPTTAEFPVKKILSVPDELDGPETWSYTINVAAQDGAPEAETMTGTVDQDNDTVTFGDFTYTAKGTYTYKVTETGTIAGVTNDAAATTGKTVTVTVVDNGNGTLTATADSTTEEPLTFTNTYASTPAEVEEFLFKKVESMPPATESVVFNFELEGPDETTDTRTATVTATEAGTYTIDFGEGAFRFTEPGEYSYTLTELTTGLDAGWITEGSPAEFTIVVTDNGEGALVAEVADQTITNKYETVSPSGEKTWDDSEYVGQPGYERPESINVTLYAETKNADDTYTTVNTYAKTVTPGADGKWTYSWTDLPKYNNGKEIRYTVKEEVPAGYTAQEEGMDIVNTPVDKTDVIDPVKLKIQKTDAASGGALPGAVFDVIDSKGQKVTSVTTDANGEAEITFTYADTYTMNETAPTGYTSDPGEWTIVVKQSGVDSVKYDDPNKGVWNWLYHLFFGEGTTYEKGTLKVSNPPDLTQVTPVKVWNDNADKDEVRPDSVTFGLYKTVGEEGTPVAVTDKDGNNVTVTISKPSGDTVNRWTGETIENLPAYENGQPVTYSFKELDGETALEAGDKLPGKVDAEGNATEYTVSYSEDGLTVTNSHQSKPDKEVYEDPETTIKIDGEVVQPGQEITYKITYTNTTGEDVEATITDNIPKYTEFVSASEGGQEADGVVTWADIAVADGETVTVTLTVKVSDNVTGETIFNEATVYDGENEYDTNEVGNPTPPKKDVFESLTSETSIDGEVVQPGQELVYKITYSNTTGEDVKVTITDKIPKYTTFVSAEDGGENRGGTVTWEDVEVKNNESVTVAFTVKVDEAVTGETIFNDAKVREGENEYDTNPVSNHTPPKKEAFEDPEMTIKIDGEVVKPGQELTYKITYTNTSGADVTAIITDKIPEYTTFVSAEDGGQESGGVVRWDDIDVPNGESVTVSFTVKVTEDVAGETVFNEATVYDGENEYATNPVSNPTPPKKDVFETPESTTSIDGKAVKAEQELVYKITYKNTSGKKIDKLEITDAFPANTTYVEDSASYVVTDAEGTEVSTGTGAKNEAGDGLIWTVADVENGQTVVATFIVTVKENNGVAVDNTAIAKVGENQYDTNTTHNPVPETPKKTVTTGTSTANIDGNPVKIGQVLNYTITYKNTIDTAATLEEGSKIAVTDTYPALTEYVANSAVYTVTDADGKEVSTGTGSESGGTVTWNLNLKYGETVTATFSVKVKDTVSGEILENTGKVTDDTNKFDIDTNTTENPTPRQLVITKNLANFVDHGNDVTATFAFKVEGTSESYGGTYSTVVAMEFTGAETKELTVKGIPYDIKDLKVTEIGTGNYTPTVKADLAVDEADGKWKISFENTYDDSEYKTGVINNYKRTEGEDGKTTYETGDRGDQKSQTPTNKGTTDPAEVTPPGGEVNN